MTPPLLVFNDKGIYCELANIYIDPWKPVERAIITHGHADHARWGHKYYLTHTDGVGILKHRLGDISVTGKVYGESWTINGVKFSLHPAGHIIGSAQVRVEYRGEVWVFSGDYKIEDDGLSTPFEPIRCNAFISECTFGLPAFNWRPQQEVARDINSWWSSNQAEKKTSVLFGYTLGKIQRLMHCLNTDIGTLYTHGAVENMTEVLRQVTSLPSTKRITKDTTKEELSGALVLAPPSAHGSIWIKKMVPYVTAMASGWMAFRGARRRRAIDRGFVLSDHADWQGLLRAIRATGCEKVICTHGHANIFCRYLNEIGYDARTAETQYEGELSELDQKEDEDN